jgi:hypothetical protein
VGFLNMQKLVKLPNELTIATGRYYLSRLQSGWKYESSTFSKEKETITFVKPKPWDKEFYMNLISTAALKHFVSFESVAGTFWFCKKDGTVYQMSEETWPLAGKVK